MNAKELPLAAILSCLSHSEIRKCRLVSKDWDVIVRRDRELLLGGPWYRHRLRLTDYKNHVQQEHIHLSRYHIECPPKDTTHKPICYFVSYSVVLFQGVSVLSEGMPKTLVDCVICHLDKYTLCAIRSTRGKTRIVMVHCLRYDEMGLLRFA